MVFRGRPAHPFNERGPNVRSARQTDEWFKSGFVWFRLSVTHVYLIDDWIHVVHRIKLPISVAVHLYILIASCGL